MNQFETIKKTDSIQNSTNCFFGASKNATSFIQPKLTINQPNDVYEQEADAMADKVMRMEQPDVQLKPLPIAAVQRKCEHCEEEEKKMQRKEMNEKETTADSSLENYVSSLSGGQSLPDEARNFYEPRFGHDFSNVKIHTDTVAAKSAQSINALAYTSGNNIVFNTGQYSPDSNSGKRLLGHELTHVVQQKQNSAIQRLTVTTPSFTKGKCGERRVRWIFGLSNPAPEDGYIVQNVEMYEITGNCTGGLPVQGPPAPVLSFWEAWFVNKGASFEQLHSSFGYTDESRMAAQTGTNGTKAAYGTIKFFPKSVTGDLGKDNTPSSDPASPWGPGRVPLSQSLPSTPTRPGWWGSTPTEGPGSRQAISIWDCCNADPARHVSDVTAQP